MKFKQSKSGYKLIFTFNDNKLHYAYKASDGFGDYDINYADFSSKSHTIIEQNDWCKNVGTLWILLGIVLNLYRYYTIHLFDKIGIIIIGLGISCILWTTFRKIKFTIFNTPQGNVLIIKNGKHDKIVNEIQSRRKKQLFELYSQIDFNNNIENEIKKFEWLREENILSPKEANDKILQIKEGITERIGFIQESF